MTRAWSALAPLALPLAVLVACGRAEPSSATAPAAPSPDVAAAPAALAPDVAAAPAALAPDIGEAPALDEVSRVVPGAPVEVGSLRDREVSFDYGVIVPEGAAVATAKASIEDALREASIPIVALDSEPPAGFAAAVTVTTPDELGLRPEVLRLFGRGIEADRARIEKATTAVAILVKGPAADLAAVVRASAAAASRGAAAIGGWPIDLVTSEVFGAPELAERHAAGHEHDVERLVDVHMVREPSGTKVFVQTIGLQRLGVPDVVIRDLDLPLAERARTVLLGAAQLLLERGSITRRGVLDLDLAALAEPAWRERAAAVRAAGGSGRVTLRATGSANTIPDEPPIIALTFESDDLARVLDAAVGKPLVEVTGAAADDPELAAARARAMTALAALAPHFASGVPDGERLRVKARFAEGDVVEWMWVEVTAWTGDALTGVLMNEPTALALVHNGAHVTVRRGELFDYVHIRRDGTAEGDETTRILEARAAR